MACIWRNPLSHTHYIPFSIFLSKKFLGGNKQAWVKDLGSWWPFQAPDLMMTLVSSPTHSALMGKVRGFFRIVGYFWDRLGPGTLCCSTCTWTNTSLSNRMQRNYKGLKITACMCCWGKLPTIRFKKSKNPTATSEEQEAKTEYCACFLHTVSPKGEQAT